MKGTLSPEIRLSMVALDLDEAPEPDLLWDKLEDGGTAGADRTGSVEFIVHGVATSSMMRPSLVGCTPIRAVPAHSFYFRPSSSRIRCMFLVVSETAICGAHVFHGDVVESSPPGTFQPLGP